MYLTEHQKTIIRCIDAIVILLYSLNLCAIIFNIVKFIYKQGIQSMLIIVFYTCVLSFTIARIGEFSLRAHDPDEAYFGTQSKIIIRGF